MKNNNGKKSDSKYIYHSEIYKIWKMGACLVDECYYSCNKPLKFRKKDLVLKKKDYQLRRTIELISKPKNLEDNE